MPSFFEINAVFIAEPIPIKEGRRLLPVPLGLSSSNQIPYADPATSLPKRPFV
jgi:hypothetical protein